MGVEGEGRRGRSERRWIRFTLEALVSSWMDCVEESAACAIWDKWRENGEGGSFLDYWEGEDCGMVGLDLRCRKREAGGREGEEAMAN